MGKEAGFDIRHPSSDNRDVAVPEAGQRTATCLRQSREQRCETRTLQGEKAGYLSKFSPGLFFLHSSMCNQVVEDLSCTREKKREGIREQQKALEIEGETERAVNEKSVNKEKTDAKNAERNNK